ncbi:MAG: type II toxin-antitoxin system HicA family toxin [Ezakiella sp.]
MKSYNSRELIKEAKKRGFVLIRINGSHHIFKNYDTGATVIIPHPKDGFKTGTLKSILKAMGM